MVGKPALRGGLIKLQQVSCGCSIVGYHLLCGAESQGKKSKKGRLSVSGPKISGTDAMADYSLSCVGWIRSEIIWVPSKRIWLP